MTRGGRLAAAMCAVVLMAGAAGVAQAQMAAALVLETTGATEPALQPFTEILDTATVSLSHGARLVFLHYHTCKKVIVEGGRITVKSQGYAIAGATNALEERVPCPPTVRLRKGGEMAGILLRGITPTLSAKPAFVLIGPRAADFTSVRVSQGNQVVFEARLDGRTFQWPTEAAPLSPDPEYELALIPTVAGAAPFTLKFKTAPPSALPAGAAHTLIHVE